MIFLTRHTHTNTYTVSQTHVYTKLVIITKQAYKALHYFCFSAQHLPITLYLFYVFFAFIHHWCYVALHMSFCHRIPSPPPPSHAQPISVYSYKSIKHYAICLKFICLFVKHLFQQSLKQSTHPSIHLNIQFLNVLWKVPSGTKKKRRKKKKTMKMKLYFVF